MAWFSWLKHRRRKKLLAQPFPRAWHNVLETNIRHYRYLDPRQREVLERRLQVFVAEKHWEGCAGLPLTDEIRVTIAAEACLMLLGVDEQYCFDGVKTILVYPSAYLHPPEWNVVGGVVHEESAMYGESWRGGPVVLSWDEVLDNACRADGHNLVIHEFAHHLDGLDGVIDGVPPLADRSKAQRWAHVTRREFRRLAEASRRGEATLLDHYGASEESEFFAVASECFFDLPRELQRRHRALYEVLCDFYRLDPATWFRQKAVGRTA